MRQGILRQITSKTQLNWPIRSSGSWLRSYLMARTYSVRIGPYLSRPLHASSSDPEGSYMRPLIITKILRQIQGPEYHRILQASLHDFYIWYDYQAKFL